MVSSSIYLFELQYYPLPLLGKEGCPLRAGWLMNAQT